MESDNNSEKKTINIEDMTVHQSLETIWNLINKAAAKGVFTIDESYVIKILFSKITASLPKREEVKPEEISYKTSNVEKDV